jgi:hypothetical protein
MQIKYPLELCYSVNDYGSTLYIVDDKGNIIGEFYTQFTEEAFSMINVLNKHSKIMQQIKDESISTINEMGEAYNNLFRLQGNN